MYRGRPSDDDFDDLDDPDYLDDPDDIDDVDDLYEVDRRRGWHSMLGWRSRRRHTGSYDEDPGELTSYLKPVESRRDRTNPPARWAWPPRLETPADLSEYAGYAVLGFVAVTIVMIFIVLLLNR